MGRAAKIGISRDQRGVTDRDVPDPATRHVARTGSENGSAQNKTLMKVPTSVMPTRRYAARAGALKSFT